jgi:micrococcal nuclease
MPWDFRAGKRGASTSAPTVNYPTTPKPAAPTSNCSPAYPDVCIPPAPPDLNCGDISERRFTVLAPDPHRFDGDGDGVGCES